MPRAGWHWDFQPPSPLPARGASYSLHCSSSLLSPQSFTLSQTQNLGLHQPLWHLNCWSVQAEKGAREIRGETGKGTREHPGTSTAGNAAAAWDREHVHKYGTRTGHSAAFPPPRGTKPAGMSGEAEVRAAGQPEAPTRAKRLLQPTGKRPR